MINSIKAFFDRNYNLFFNKKNCIKLDYLGGNFDYNYIVSDGTNTLRYLLNGWFVKCK